MMNILDRYIGKNVFINIALSLLVLVSLDSFFVLVAELDEAGLGDYDYFEVLVYTLLTVFHRIVVYFPVSALLGTVIGLGMLASNSELTVMRAAGISVTRIVLSVMKTGIILIVAVLLIAEFVVPPAEQYAETRRSLKRAEQSALKSEYGFWSRDGYSFINIRTIDVKGRIGDVYIYEFDRDYRLRRSTYASEATHINNEWVLKDIVQSDIFDTHVKTSQHNEAKWASLLNPDLLNIVAVNPLRMRMTELYSYVNYLRDNGQNADRFALALWNRLILPLSITVMLLLAVPFVFGPLRSVGIGQRIMVGFLVGLGFHLLSQAFSHLGIVYSLPPSLSALLPVLLFFGIVMHLLRRI